MKWLLLLMALGALVCVVTMGYMTGESGPPPEPGPGLAAGTAPEPMYSVPQTPPPEATNAPETGRDPVPGAKPATKPATHPGPIVGHQRHYTRKTRKHIPASTPGNAETVPFDLQPIPPATMPASPQPATQQDLAQQERHVDEVLMEVRSLRQTLVDEQAAQAAPECRQSER